MSNQTEMGYWPQSGLFPIKIVGTRFYRESIARIAQNPQGESALVFCNVSLVPEGNNPYDEQAVLVAVGSEKLGHLSRDLASAFRKRLCSFGLDDIQTQCRAVISAGLEAQDKTYDYIVELDLDLASQPTVSESSAGAIDRRDFNFCLESQGDGTYLVRVWLGESVLGNMHKSKKIHAWTTEGWDVINYYVLNSQGIGLGHKLFSVPKADHLQLFRNIPPIVSFRSVTGRNAVIEVAAGG
jgi:HIRAN domain-containing protein